MPHKKGIKIRICAFPPLLCSPLGLKGKGRHPASRGSGSVGGKGSRAGGRGLSSSCWEVWETWVPVGSKLPPALYQKQHQCLANVTLPRASQLGGPFPPPIAPFPLLPPSPAAGWGRQDGDALVSGWPWDWGGEAGSSAGDGAPSPSPLLSQAPLLTRQFSSLAPLGTF